MLRSILRWIISSNIRYRNDPKFSDRQVWANSADPDQTAPSKLIRANTVCNSGCIFWVHYSSVKPSCSNFRVITAIFFGVSEFLGFVRYVLYIKTGIFPEALLRAIFLDINRPRYPGFTRGFSNYLI